MDQIKHIQKNDLDKILRNGKDLILFFYRKDDPASTLGINTMKEVNSLIGKSFELYLIDFDAQPEISEAFSVKNIPEYISMKNRKIFKRNTALLKSSEVLAMLK